MTDLFEEDDAEVTELAADFEDLDAELESIEIPGDLMDARRRLESVLDERRLKEELEDFGDF